MRRILWVQCHCLSVEGSLEGTPSVQMDNIIIATMCGQITFAQSDHTGQIYDRLLTMTMLMMLIIIMPNRDYC